jgi:hypothetical protein
MLTPAGTTGRQGNEVGEMPVYVERRVSYCRRRRAPSAIAAAMLLLGLSGGQLAGASGASAQTAHTASAKQGFAVKVKSGTITLTLSATALATIDRGSATLGSHLSVIAPATEATPGSFRFPISKGTLNSVTAHGSVSAKGGLMSESHLDVGGLLEQSSTATGTAPALVIASSARLSITSPNFTPSTVAIINLSLKHAKVRSTRHSVTISKISATLSSTGAQFFLNSAVLKAGSQLGTVTIQAKG